MFGKLVLSAGIINHDNVDGSDISNDGMNIDVN